MLAHGPVRVPADAKVGPAIMRVRMRDDSMFASFPTDIPVLVQ